MLPFVAIALLVLVTAYTAWASFRKTADDVIEQSGSSRQSTLVRIVICVSSVAVLFGMAAWFLSSAKETGRRSARFLIPDGYVGWVRIEFEVTGAPATPLVNQEYVFKLPLSGMLQTSSTEQQGWTDAHYYYCTAQETCKELPSQDASGRGWIWGRMSGEHAGPSGSKTYEEFFVGSEQQFREQLGGKNPT